MRGSPFVVLDVRGFGYVVSGMRYGVLEVGGFWFGVMRFGVVEVRGSGFLGRGSRTGFSRSGSGLRGSRTGFRGSGSGLRVRGFVIRGFCRFEVSSTEFQVWGFGYVVS